jgi:plastocyanin
VSTCERGTSTRRGRAAAVVLALSGVALAAVTTPAWATTGEVTIAGMAFSPEPVTVELTEGEPEQPQPHAHVNFVMRDEGVQHTVFFEDRTVAVGSSGRLSAGQTYVVEFEAPGTFLYRCEIHPNMTGTVLVTAPAASSRNEADGEEEGSGASIGILLLVAGLAAAAGGVAVLLVRGRRRAAGAEKAGTRPTRPGGS